MVSYKNINKFALVSVYNKSKIKTVCNVLNKFNIGIISTGSTYKKIKSLGFRCFEISKLTRSKEVLSGRVKTLHPKIYTSILYDRNKKKHINTFEETRFPKIDYVIVNLYPFEKYLKLKMAEEKPLSRWQRFVDNDVLWSFIHNPGAMIAATIAASFIIAAFAAPWIAPYNG